MALKRCLKLKPALHILSFSYWMQVLQAQVHQSHLSNTAGELPFSSATAVPWLLWTLLILDQKIDSLACPQTCLITRTLPVGLDPELQPACLAEILAGEAPALPPAMSCLAPCLSGLCFRMKSCRMQLQWLLGHEKRETKESCSILPGRTTLRAPISSLPEPTVQETAVRLATQQEVCRGRHLRRAELSRERIGRYDLKGLCIRAALQVD